MTEKGKIFIPSGDVANEKQLIELIHQYNYDILSVKVFSRFLRSLENDF
jgi:hypothetical protein